MSLDNLFQRIGSIYEEEEWTHDEDGNAYLVEPYDRTVTGYIEEAKFWSSKAKEHVKGILIPLLPGSDDSFLYERDLRPSYIIRTDPSPEKYRIMCEGIKPYIDDKTNMIIAGHWNEIWEQSVIEPTEEFSFSYLDVIREVYTNAPLEHEDIYP